MSASLPDRAPEATAAHDPPRAVPCALPRPVRAGSV